jgi:OmcA/MtrC family decaheme c-type cytochrome
MVGTRSFMTLAASVLAVVLGGCGGDGDQGPAGPAGPPGDIGEPVVKRGEVTALEVEITGAEIGSPPVVDFRLTDQDGLPFVGLPPGTLEFTVAKLVAADEGRASHWQSYINEVEEPRAGPGTESAIQAATDEGGELEDFGDGTYTYTFGTDVAAVTAPLSVPFEPELTHRVALAIRSGTLPAPRNGIFTWQPSTGATTEIPSRAITSIDSCNECHGELEAHGGPRNDTRMCVTCHNPGSADANSGNTIDFPVMVHKIHMGEELPSVEAGGEYALFGFRDSKADYSDVAFPQDIRNCTKCHDPADSMTPDAGNFAQRPSIEACGACHDDVNFATAENHAGGVVQDNSECTVCHAENRIAGSVAASHAVPGKEAAQRFAYNILDIQDTAPGQTPSVQFSITDPTADDAPYDVLSDAPFTGSGASLNLDIAWPTTDYTNFDPDTGRVAGSAPARPVSFSLLDPANVTDNGDGTFTAALPISIPDSLEGSGAVAIEGHPAGDFDGDGSFSDQIPATGAVEFFAVTDSTPQPRRTVVELGKCQSCHGENDGLAFHGNNRTDSIQLCVVCHNANSTDLTQRPADPDGVEDGINTAAADALEERSIDFKRLIHGIHGAQQRSIPFEVYGFFNTPHDFSTVRYPRESGECEACHSDGSHRLPLSETVLASTIDTQATVNNASPFGSSDFIPGDGSAGDPTDDGNVTAVAAACSSCHDGTEARAHMVDNGAGISVEMPGAGSSGTGTSRFDVLQSDVDGGVVIETCRVCHGPGRIADVDVVHGLVEAP